MCTWQKLFSFSKQQFAVFPAFTNSRLFLPWGVRHTTMTLRYPQMPLKRSPNNLLCCRSHSLIFVTWPVLRKNALNFLKTEYWYCINLQGGEGSSLLTSQTSLSSVGYNSSPISSINQTEKLRSCDVRKQSTIREIKNFSRVLGIATHIANTQTTILLKRISP